MRKLILQLGIFSVIMGTIPLLLKNELTGFDKLFILGLAVNASLYFSLQLDLMKLMEENKDD